MTIQVNICHQNKGYNKKLRITQFNQHHETGEWVPVYVDIVPDGECITKYVHQGARVLVEEEQVDEQKE